MQINATLRNTQGTGASRRLRKAGRVPAVVYGVKDAVAIELDHNDIYHKMRQEVFHASLLDLVIDGKKESVLLRDFQMHPFRQQVMHVDFQRVKAGEKIHIHVPLHFLNEENAPGVKLGSGTVSHVINDLEVMCLPKNIPAFIEVEMGALELGDSVHVSDLKLPSGIELADSSEEFLESVVASLHAPRVEKEPEEPVAGEAAVGEAAAVKADDEDKK
ncbi:MAG: 50S ribosomal protein L25/general stress protein Ctc [Pseudomonadota bacterium]